MYIMTLLKMLWSLQRYPRAISYLKLDTKTCHCKAMPYSLLSIYIHTFSNHIFYLSKSRTFLTCYHTYMSLKELRIIRENKEIIIIFLIFH